MVFTEMVCAEFYNILTRVGHITMDVSADLTELGKTCIAVVSAGVKSILDIGRTLEFLETQVCKSPNAIWLTPIGSICRRLWHGRFPRIFYR